MTLYGRNVPFGFIVFICVDLIEWNDFCISTLNMNDGTTAPMNSVNFPL